MITKKKGNKKKKKKEKDKNNGSSVVRIALGEGTANYFNNKMYVLQ